MNSQDVPPGRREAFDRLSNEYAQALQALEAIETQASTLLLLGNAPDLLGFVDRFVDMASATRASAQEEGEANFVEWFGELIERAKVLRKSVELRRESTGEDR